MHKYYSFHERILCHIFVSAYLDKDTQTHSSALVTTWCTAHVLQ